MSAYYYPSGGSGGGGGGGATIDTYPNFAAFPISATDGTIAVALDTGVAYAYSAGAGGWIAQRNYNPRAAITLTIGDIANKYVDLIVAPSAPNLTRLSVIGGAEQLYGTDFSISGSLLTWNGYNLDGVLEAGDQLIVNLVR